MISPKPLTPPLHIDSWKHPLTPTFKREQRAYRPERKPVTIATGFIYDGGMLFCADTKITDVIKTNESKIVHFRSENGNCSITFAMSSDDMNFPRMAVLKVLGICAPN